MSEVMITSVSSFRRNGFTERALRSLFGLFNIACNGSS